MIFPEKRIPSLDGVRAFAIATVILCHIQQRFTFGRIGPPPADGVELFFVLSGFLITSLLLKEQESYGSIGLFRFYGRRASRVLPPLVAYLGVVIAVCLAAAQAVPWHSILGSALLVSGVYPQNGAVLTSQLWSLAVEEQFYLVWPVLMIWALRRGGKQLAARVCIALIAVSPFVRIGITLLHLQVLAHRQGFIMPGRMDSLFAGCLVALWIGSPRFEAAYVKLKRFWWVGLLFFCLVSPMLRYALGNAYTFTLGYTLESVCAAYFVVWSTRNAHTVAGRVLNARPVMFVGVTSYSLYLYHVLIVEEWQARWGGPFLVLVAALLAGFVAFYVVEVPVMWLRAGSRERQRQKRQAARDRAAEKHTLENARLSAEAAGR